MLFRWRAYLPYLLIYLSFMIFTIVIWRSKNCPGITAPKTDFTIPKLNTSKKQICIDIVGRLGNNMFLFASAYGIARTKGMQLTLIKKYLSQPLMTIFNITSIPIVPACPQFSITDLTGSKFAPEFITFKNDKDLNLIGYFQSWIYFAHVEKELRRIFVFQEKIKETASDILRTILTKHLKQSRNAATEDVSFVGVHVRRGDLLTKANVDLGYITAPADYFLNATLYFRNKFAHPIFVVCSDDIQWSQEILGNNDTYYVHEPLGIDMAVLAQCNHSISSIGTFSWWTAWLTKGIKVYYPYQAKPGSWLRNTFSQKLYDYFPLNWIPII